MFLDIEERVVGRGLTQRLAFKVLSVTVVSFVCRGAEESISAT